MGIVNKIEETKKLEQRAVSLTQSEIEFILFLFSESMIPGRKLIEAVSASEDTIRFIALQQFPLLGLFLWLCVLLYHNLHLHALPLQYQGH